MDNHWKSVKEKRAPYRWNTGSETTLGNQIEKVSQIIECIVVNKVKGAISSSEKWTWTALTAMSSDSKSDLSQEQVIAERKDNASQAEILVQVSSARRRRVN